MATTCTSTCRWRPWEAVLGTTVDLPTLAGTVRLKVPPNTQAGRRLRLARRGLPRPDGGEGDLFALVQLVVPDQAGERERALYEQLAASIGLRAAQAFRPGGARVPTETIDAVWVTETQTYTHLGGADAVGSVRDRAARAGGTRRTADLLIRRRRPWTFNQGRACWRCAPRSVIGSGFDLEPHGVALVMSLLERIRGLESQLGAAAGPGGAAALNSGPIPGRRQVELVQVDAAFLIAQCAPVDLVGVGLSGAAHPRRGRAQR